MLSSVARKLLLLGLVGILGIVLTAQTPTPTPLPIPNPDEVAVRHSRAYVGLLETDDVLVLVHYLIRYDTVPSTSASQAFLLRLFQGSTEIESTRPFVRDVGGTNLGYEESVVGFYFSAERASSLGLLTGGSLVSTVTFRISGSPAYPGISTSHQVNISQATGVQRIDLVSDLGTIIGVLEEDWGLRVIDRTGATVQLTGDGQDYFVTTVPRLADILPEIFPQVVLPPQFAQEDFQQSLYTQRETFVQNTPFYTLAQSFEGWIGVPTTLGTSLIWFLLIWAAVAFFIGSTRQQDFAINIAVFLLMVGAFIGMVPGVLGIGMVGLFTVGPTVAIAFLKRHSG